MAEYEQDLGEDLFYQLLDVIIPEKKIHVREKLGAGFFAEVHRADYVNNGTFKVAVKFLKGNQVFWNYIIQRAKSLLNGPPTSQNAQSFGPKVLLPWSGPWCSAAYSVILHKISLTDTIKTVKNTLQKTVSLLQVMEKILQMLGSFLKGSTRLENFHTHIYWAGLASQEYRENMLPSHNTWVMVDFENIFSNRLTRWVCAFP